MSSRRPDRGQTSTGWEIYANPFCYREQTATMVVKAVRKSLIFIGISQRIRTFGTQGISSNDASPTTLRPETTMGYEPRVEPPALARLRGLAGFEEGPLRPCAGHCCPIDRGQDAGAPAACPRVFRMGAGRRPSS